MFQPRKARASARLNAMNLKFRTRLPWTLTFSFSRAIQQSALGLTIWGERLTTVWPRQGRHALAPKTLAAYPPADLTVERIEDLVNYDLPALLGANAGRRTALRV